MTDIAYLTDVVVVEKILAHLGLPTCPPRLSPARLSAQVEMFEDEDEVDGPLHLADSARPSRRSGRGPPPTRDDLASLDTDDATSTCDWAA
jgi:hypothetical protein